MSTPQPRAYTVILDWLEERLRSGDISVGDKLPAERQLAEDFSISRASVREAIRVLDAMGLVRSATGSGPNAGAVVISEPSAALAWALRMHVATRSLPVRDLVQTRLVLETQSAVEAAAAPDSPERVQILKEAAALVDMMDAPDLPADEFHTRDAQFHILLASLAGNVVVETIMTSLRQATISYVQETVAGLGNWRDVSCALQQQHRGILQAVEERRGEDAAAALREHIVWFFSLSGLKQRSGLAADSLIPWGQCAARIQTAPWTYPAPAPPAHPWPTSR
ncbi:FadR/GntR family transcriptional regulator [Corynebacterium marinum]|uniref:GntR family transcriptional regulator n=1 Tax=Corynebacterium marinum DSM 44953 TaxID=1224162 RepID=A0A0B6TNA2_9CORY|nr:FCD domain-containing protein [Corynebacterium marinum]AJK67744.1 GntR family transcriptional regulator [Corynebacterium marinum DSM 44953]GGO12587.1 GntR family transcriptional regulator [Corynebacterium marinum]